MAIGKKIPSPQEVSKSPTSFSEEELNELKELKLNISELNAQFGQLTINKIKLEEQEIILKKQLVELEKKESLIAKNLTTKYGKGSIDLETGTFTPSE
jgi:predicted FMN-binding regulatory protein PaiB